MRRPILVGIAGGSGSGKTTVAEEIMHESGQPMVFLKQDSYYRNFDGLTIELPENLRLIDLADALCETHTCAPVVGNVFVYRDHKHMTNTYAGTLAGAVSDALRDAAPALF